MNGARRNLTHNALFDTMTDSSFCFNFLFAVHVTLIRLEKTFELSYGKLSCLPSFREIKIRPEDNYKFICRLKEVCWLVIVTCSSSGYWSFSDQPAAIYLLQFDLTAFKAVFV